MSSKPKKSDYTPGKDLLAQASAALGNHRNFQQLYQPILRGMRDLNPELQLKDTAGRRAQADWAQTFTNKDSVDARLVGSTDVDKARSMGSSSLAASADQQVKKAHNDQQLGVLAAARGQEATNQSAASQLSQIETSSRLGDAARTLSRAQTLASAGGQLAGTFLGQGIRNLKTGGGFFSPMKPSGEINEDGSKRMTDMTAKDKLIFGLGGAFR